VSCTPASYSEDSQFKCQPRNPPVLHWLVHQKSWSWDHWQCFRHHSYWTRSTARSNAAVCAGDMKMFSVAYGSSFIPKHLLNYNNFDIYKKVWYLKCYHHLISTQDSRSMAVHESHTYPTENLVENICAAVTVLENVMSKVSQLEWVEWYVIDAIENGIDFN
jgi:hypothetical protein